MDLLSKKHFMLHNNSSSASQQTHNKSSSSNGSKGRSFWGISLGRNDSSDSNKSDNSPIQSVHSADHHHHQQQQNQHQQYHHHQQQQQQQQQQQLDSQSIHHGESHNAMHELKRFYRPFIKKHTNTTSNNNSTSINPSVNASTISLGKSDSFDSDSALARKYGRLGRVLGSGAGGSVRLLTRPSDGVTFAVKEFRDRKPGEQPKEYAKKCTAEFCIGSTLHHPNIIQTLDIAHENGHYFEVMEYAPIDFFAVVMSGKMIRGEINCCLRQITEGVKYLHNMGLAHRDLKLDNCVCTKDGILKLIDFGSAVVFRYPFEENIVKAHGVVGSDPYLAPEVLTQREYNPQPVDVWSIAIIYCCMTLKRFPWKAPKQSDPSFKLYCMEDDEPHDYVKSAEQHKILIQKRREERLQKENDEHSNTDSVNDVTKHLQETTIHPEPNKSNNTASEKSIHSHEQESQKKELQQQEQPSTATSTTDTKSNDSKPKPHHRTIHGPYRLMRLLPHAARPIISKMLEVDPEKRATLDDVFNDPWFASIIPCTINKDGSVFHAPGHTHTIVKEENAHLESYKEKK